VRKFFEDNPKLKPVAITLLIYLFLGAFIYTSLSDDSQVKVEEKEQRVADDDAEIHPVRTYLRVDNGYRIIDYYVRLDTTNTLMSLLDYHRSKSGFTFSQKQYTYGTLLDDINGYKAPEGYVWRVYDNNEEITYNIRDTKLQNEHQYLLKLEPIE